MLMLKKFIGRWAQVLVILALPLGVASSWVCAEDYRYQFKSGDILESPKSTPAPQRYRVVRPLGHGGLADVYEVSQELADGKSKRLALKIIKDKYDVVTQTMVMQAHQLIIEKRKSIACPNLLEITKLGELNVGEKQYQFIAMELALSSLESLFEDEDGGVDFTLLKESLPKPHEQMAFLTKLTDDLLLIFKGLSSGAFAIVHEDIRDGNFLFMPVDEKSENLEGLTPRDYLEGRVKMVLADFDLTHYSGEPVDSEQGTMGTVHAISPEYYLETVKYHEPSRDAFALGNLLFEFLTGDLSPYFQFIFAPEFPVGERKSLLYSGDDFYAYKGVYLKLTHNPQLKKIYDDWLSQYIDKKFNKNYPGIMSDPRLRAEYEKIKALVIKLTALDPVARNP